MWQALLVSCFKNLLQPTLRPPAFSPRHPGQSAASVSRRTPTTSRKMTTLTGGSEGGEHLLGIKYFLIKVCILFLDMLLPT